jgi:DNA primase
VKNMVASLGTALTPEQVKLIARFARKVVVNYDGDRAGVQAAKRAIETFWQKTLKSRFWSSRTTQILTISSENTAFPNITARRGEAQPQIQFVIDQALRDRNLHNPADKAAAVEETLPFVRAVRGAGFSGASTLTSRWTRCACSRISAASLAAARGGASGRDNRQADSE